MRSTARRVRKKPRRFKLEPPETPLYKDYKFFVVLVVLVVVIVLYNTFGRGDDDCIGIGSQDRATQLYACRP